MITLPTNELPDRPKPFTLAEPKLSDSNNFADLLSIVDDLRLRMSNQLTNIDSDNLQIETIKELAELIWASFPLEDDEMFPYVRYTKLSTRRRRPQNIYGTATIPDLLASYHNHFELMPSRPKANEEQGIWMDCKLPAFVMNGVMQAHGVNSRIFSIPFLREIAHPIVGVKVGPSHSLYINFFQRSVEFIDSAMPHAKLPDETMGSRVFPLAEQGMVLADLIMLATEAVSYLVYADLDNDERQECLNRLIVSTQSLGTNFGEDNYYYQYFSKAVNQFT